MRAAVVRLLLVLACFGQPAAAHDLAVVRAALIAEGGGRYLLDLRATAGPPGGGLVLPRRCVADGPPVVDTIGDEAALRFAFTCPDPLDAADQLTIPGGRGGAFVTLRTEDGAAASGFFPGAPDGVTVMLGDLIAAERPWFEALGDYVGLGIGHILAGWDHLAFVLGLCLVTRGLALVRLITAFTIGHSITLALAVLGAIDVPRPPVDACIALSIAVVAREALLTERAEGHGALLAFGFGLLHGLGFASALSEAGMRGLGLIVGLVGFNLGVEIGQLLFVAMILLAGWLGRDLPRHDLVRPGLAFAIGTLGTYWLLQRVAAF